MSRRNAVTQLFRKMVTQPADQWPAREAVFHDQLLLCAYDLFWRIADVRDLRIGQGNGFEKGEGERGRWYCIFHTTSTRYRWQMPDEETARAVEQYGQKGGGFLFAQRKAIRSYKWDDALNKWVLVNIKNSKKWKTRAKERAREKAVKRRQRRRKRLERERMEQEHALSEENQ